MVVLVDSISCEKNDNSDINSIDDDDSNSDVEVDSDEDVNSDNSNDNDMGFYLASSHSYFLSLPLLPHFGEDMSSE